MIKVKFVAITGLVFLAAWTARVAAAADDAFADFISPVSNPTNFEDPRATSEVRPIYVYHKIDGNFLKGLQTKTGGAFRAPGGDAHVVAVQLRAAITDRLAIIATKDGYVWHNPQHEFAGVIDQDSGWANIAAGLKYTLFRDVAIPALATVGLRYEAPTGDKQVFQGPVFSLKTPINLSKQGAGVLNPFVSGGYGFGDLHALLYIGGRVAMDSLDSNFFDLSLHVDYKIQQFYPLIELNWVQVLHGGSRMGPVEKAFGAKMTQEGFDFFNLGAPSAEGGVVTMAFGGRWRILNDLDLFGRKGGLDLGCTYELPVTSRADLFGWRVTTDLVLWAL